jgi:hypothetical protein
MSNVFSIGQRVELYPTIPSSFGGSIPNGTRGIVQEIEEHGDEALYLVAFMISETLTGETAWL